jgi:hypothetical protein
MSKVNNVNLKNKEGRTFLMEAVAWNNEDTVQALLDMNVNVNEIDNEGKTALIIGKINFLFFKWQSEVAAQTYHSSILLMIRYYLL